MSLTKIFLGVATAAGLSIGTAAAQTEVKLGHVGEPGSLFELSSRGIRQTRQREARRQGQGRGLRLEPARQRRGAAAEAEARHRRHGAALDGDDLGGRRSSACSRCRIWSRTATTCARIEKEVFWPTLAPEAEKQGYKVLAVWENGFRHITNNKRPIKRPRTCRASSCACPSGEWRVKMFQAYGANPTPDEVLRGVHRAADRRDGRPGEPADADLQRQASTKCRSTCR